MAKRIIEFLGTCAAAWMTVGSIRLATYFADSVAWWLAWVAAACVFGLFALLMTAEWIARMVLQQP